MKQPENVRVAYRHRDGEPVFSEQWHAEVIAVVDLLIADGKIDAQIWSETLGEELRRHGSAEDASDTDEAYYAAFLRALERILETSRFAMRVEIDKREDDWREAYLSTPHGKPVTLIR